MGHKVWFTDRIHTIEKFTTGNCTSMIFYRYGTLTFLVRNSLWKRFGITDDSELGRRFRGEKGKDGEPEENATRVNRTLSLIWFKILFMKNRSSRSFMVFYSTPRQNVFDIKFVLHSECKLPFTNFSIMIIYFSNILFIYDMIPKLWRQLSRVVSHDPDILLVSVRYQKLLSVFVRVSGRLYKWLMIFHRNHADQRLIWSFTVWSVTNGLTNFPLNNFVKTLAESICHFYETNMDTLFMRLSELISKELSSWHHSIPRLPEQYFHSNRNVRNCCKMIL